jgi:hypothetical protein
VNKPQVIGYCQGCQNFITDHDPIVQWGSLFYHDRCAPIRPHARPTPPPPVRKPSQPLNPILRGLIIAPAALIAGVMLLGLCILFPPLALGLVLFPIFYVSARNRQRNMYFVIRAGVRDGIEDVRRQR